MFTRRFRSVSFVLVAALLALAGIASLSTETASGVTLAGSSCCVKG